MKKLIGVTAFFFSVTIFATPSRSVVVSIPAGLSRSVKVDFNIARQEMDPNDSLNYQLVSNGSSAREVFLFGMSPGNATLRFGDRSGANHVVIEVRVTPAGQTEIDRQIVEERLAGINVDVIKVEGPRTLLFKKEIGPILVTNPSVVDYLRVNSKELKVTNTSKGITDLLVYDTSGGLQLKVYLISTDEGLGLGPVGRPMLPR